MPTATGAAMAATGTWEDVEDEDEDEEDEDGVGPDPLCELAGDAPFVAMAACPADVEEDADVVVVV